MWPAPAFDNCCNTCALQSIEKIKCEQFESIPEPRYVELKCILKIKKRHSRGLEARAQQYPCYYRHNVQEVAIILKISLGSN